MHRISNHAFFRVDSPHDIGPLNLEEVSYDYDLIVVSDYDKGFLSTEQIEHICYNHSLVLLDTKKVLGDWASEALFIKINDYEYNNSKPFLNQKLRGKIIHTQGGKGCVFREKLYPVKPTDVRDTSGAGDTFIAALAVKYLQSSNIEQSICYANRCASDAVTKKGVAVI
tara:strand:- start:23 stop:529 length:507 start_codon:yes stop_codon:yes gene_type:complete